MIVGVDLCLMLVTDAAMSQPRGLIATVLAAIAGGVTLVQLRDKRATDAELIATAIALRAALAGSGAPLIVNDRPAVAHAAKLAGVHLGQDDGDPRAARSLLGPDALIGLSVTRPEEIATVDPAIIDYVGLGPVFATPTKADAAPTLGLDGTRAIGRRLSLPFVAIGGIDTDNAAAVMATGATGIAVVSAIARAADPTAAAKLLRQRLAEARAA